MNKMINILVLAAILESSSVSAQLISNGDISVYVTIKNQLLKVTLSGQGMKDFATGYLWQAVIDGEKITAISNPKVAKSGKNSLIITGMLGPINVEQRLTVLPDGDGVSEVISIQNRTEKVIALDDIHTGFSRTVNPKSDPWRLIAVPYRVQADGRVHDYKISDIARISEDSTQEINSNNTEAVKTFGDNLCDDEYKRFRSEGWIFDNGTQGMLVVKYNNRDIEYSAVNLERSTLFFGGAAFSLLAEPVRANTLPPGKTYMFGETYYKFYTGQWQRGFDKFKQFMNARGHGIGQDYDPFVHWNVLYNLGMNDSTEWKNKNWTLDHLDKEAALAKEIGCGRVYLDPGWETAWGANTWDEERLGSLKDFVEIIKEKYEMDVALWSPGQWSKNVWPVEWNIQQGDIVKKRAKVPAVGVRGQRNLALLPEAKASASSCRKLEYIRIEGLNDGWYGNNASWTAAKDDAEAWAEIDLGRTFSINSVSIGNDHFGEYSERGGVINLRVLVATNYNLNSDAITWKTVATYKGEAIKKAKIIDFQSVDARWVRIDFSGSTLVVPRIDELEVYEAEALALEAAKQAEEIVERTPLPYDFGLCMASEQWRKARLERMLALAQSGVKWFMFDFHGYMDNWPFLRRACYAKNHGHEVPATTADHIDAIYGVAREIRQQFPDIQIESHDPIWAWRVRYTPTYFRQGLKNGDYDENWAYEFMWNTLEDLKSGKAMSLYYYNLAYDIPLYLHIPINKDNEKCLAFWWMASTVRHLGIGGAKPPADPQTESKEGSHLFAAYKEAMAKYNSLKHYFTRGGFTGLDETAHLHTLPEKSGGVLMMFNLGDEAIKRVIRIPLDKLKLERDTNLMINGASARIEGNYVILEIDLEPQTPAVVEICI